MGAIHSLDFFVVVEHHTITASPHTMNYNRENRLR
jgi:hypothetical protein